MAIDGHADQARLYAVRGSLLLEAGRITPALADLERAVKLDPIDAEALTNRSQAYRWFGHIDQALADLDRALKIAPIFWQPASTAAPCATVLAITGVPWRISTAVSPSTPICPYPTSTGRRSGTPWGTKRARSPIWIDF